MNDPTRHEDDEILTMRDCYNDSSRSASCKDSCSKYKSAKRTSFKVLGLDDPCCVLTDANRALLCVLAIGRKLEEAGYRFSYYSLACNPEAFICEPRAMEYLDAMDEDKFPLTISEGEILKVGELPNANDFSCWTGLDFSDLDLNKELEIQAVIACEETRSKICLGADECSGVHECFIIGGSLLKKSPLDDE